MDTVILKGNNLEDKEQSLIIKGLMYIKSLRYFHSENNHIGKASFKYLNYILRKKEPNALRYLHLIDCKISSNLLENLLTKINLRC